MSAHRTIVRRFCQVVGIVLLIGGLACIGFGFTSFLDSAPEAGEGVPAGFKLFMAGLPLFAAGVSLVKWGFLGAGARYVAGEVAPAVTITSRAWQQGYQAGPGPYCSHCGRLGCQAHPSANPGWQGGYPSWQDENPARPGERRQGRR